MPTPKITLNLLVCASLALAAGVLAAQSSTPSSTPSATPAADLSSAVDPSATGPTDPRCLRQHPQQHARIAPVPSCIALPTRAATSARPQPRLRSPVPTDEDSTPVVTGKNGQTDPNVNPFHQAQPDKDGMMPGVKGGSIDDVNAVGTRNIGARGMGNWYSTESEIKMGKQYADEIEKSTKFITDPVVIEYVNRIGQNIVKNSDCKVPFTIKVIDYR